MPKRRRLHDGTAARLIPTATRIGASFMSIRVSGGKTFSARVKGHDLYRQVLGSIQSDRDGQSQRPFILGRGPKGPRGDRRRRPQHDAVAARPGQANPGDDRISFDLCLRLCAVDENTAISREPLDYLDQKRNADEFEWGEGRVASSEQVSNACGKLRWAELVEAIDEAPYVVANNSGVAHLAARRGRWTLCIFSASHARSPN